MSEDTINWSQADMLEVTIKQPDDFLKVRETLTELVLQVVKIKLYFRVVIFYINKVNILLHILKSYLLLMVRILP